MNISEFRKLNIEILRTNKELHALKGYIDGSLLFDYKNIYASWSGMKSYSCDYHLYITSKEDLKDGDLFYSKHGIGVFEEEGNIFLLHDSSKILDNKKVKCSKIISTTDRTLNLPNIPVTFIQTFILLYNKGVIPEEVLVEYEKYKDELAPPEWFSNWVSGNSSMIGKELYTEDEGICIVSGINHPGGKSYLETDKGRVVWNYQLNKSVFIGFTKYRLLVNESNTIKVKLLKSSWDKEQIMELLMEALYETTPRSEDEAMEWIKSKLSV